ncbi:hypothetical protein Theba_2319 [Mesotoga prima MesG1.Ag.4.2]|uniref:Uncharacterized protein n=1 Tax=Mesotoga prima MesG1.Ag.4.2 TaxID=660470 RepID=I2F7P3_9BACT|nr:hypothetical protein [Mesotoga prima]AFK07946.1 hypothetical protein Theba_2319 [Mesotoga prima MesG1.Ag.4.2]
MNYIELINNFWIANKIHKFNSLETSFYFFVLDYANNARWPESFVLPNGIVQSVFGCSRDQLIRARKKLCKFGLLAYETGDRHNPGKYTVIAHPTPTRDLPEADTRPTQDTPPCGLSKVSLNGQENCVIGDESISKTDSKPTGDLPEAYPTPTSNINKTKLKKSKVNKTGNKNILSPYGETKVSLSQSTGEGVKNEEISTGIEPESGVPEKGKTDPKEAPPCELNVSSSEIKSNGKETAQDKGGPPEVPAEGCLVVPLFEMNDPGEKQSEEDQEDFSYLESCSRYERDVMETWEAIIGPFEREWIPLLREALRKCYPSQIKTAIIAIDRSKHEVLEEIGFEYLMQPLLRGAFGRRVKKNGRKDWSDSEPFRDPIEKFKNPAREKPKTLEELLKYTV